jgi:hypothetical protein
MKPKTECMKHICFISTVLLFISFCSSAQKVKRKGAQPIDVSKNKQTQQPGPKYSMDQFMGKWQEVKRTTRKGTSVAITDTIYLFFKSEQEVETKDGTKTYMKGNCAIEDPGNILVAAADIYTIISVSQTALVLDDQEGFIHTLQKTDFFWHETLGKIPMEQEQFDNPIVPTIEQLTGNWSVYRRAAKPGATDENSVLIKYLKIDTITGAKSAKGIVTCYRKDKTETLACTLVITDNQIEIKTDSYTWMLFVYKATKKELIFGHTGSLLYYSKAL